MRIIVTGGAGFIGSHLCERLLRMGNHVWAVDNFNDFYDPALKRQNIRAVREADEQGRFELATLDIRDGDALRGLLVQAKPDVVVHLAAYAGVRPSIDNPHLYYDVNIMGSVNLLSAMREAGVSRMVFASSSSVYGNNEKVPFSESDPVDNPISPYAATKKAGELMMHAQHALHGLSVACLRFFTVYGPRQRPDLAICKFTKMIRDGEPIPVFGDGSTLRDYTYIDDIVDGVTKAIEWTGGEPRYGVFNLGECDTISLGDMIARIEAALGKSAVIKRLPRQPGDVDRTCADISLARAQLGYDPQTPFAEGIQKYVRWLEGQE